MLKDKYRNSLMAITITNGNNYYYLCQMMLSAKVKNYSQLVRNYVYVLLC